MDQPLFTMDEARRTIVPRTIRGVCDYRQWDLLAAHVRTNHVHMVVRAKEQPMSFREFDLFKAQQDFGLTLDTNRSLFPAVASVPISESLARFWVDFQPLGLALITEKARSEFLAAPLLAEVWKRSDRQIALLSGIDLNVDAAVGLNGTCDFLLCRSSNLYFVSAPVLVAVEAKRDSIPDGLGQCAAEMVAAQRFNQNAGKPIDPIYGCVTTGSVWKFLRLTGQHLDIDLDEYGIAQPDRILGVLLHCCGVTKPQVEGVRV